MARRAVRDLKATQQRARPWAEPNGWVFSTIDGSGPMRETTLHRGWDRLRRLATKHGVRPLTLHSARHTFASLALDAGKSVKWVADQLGHRDPTITLRTYAHAIREAETDLSFLPSVAVTSNVTHASPTERSGHTRVSDSGAEAADPEEEAMVTQAGFEPATPSFGGWRRPKK